jgi:MoxR-like ATPase
MSVTSIEGIPVPQCFIDLEDALDAGIKRVILYGPPGTGKTYSAQTLLIGDAGFETLICSEDMTNSEITGSLVPTLTGAWEYKEGGAVHAWKTGARYVVDEINRAGGDVVTTLMKFLDSPESAVWRNPWTRELVVPHENFSAIMTTNFENPNDIETPLRDRFPVAIKIDAAHPAALIAALPPELRMLAAVIVAGKPGERASLRAWRDFETLRKSDKFTTERAAKMIFGKMADAIIDALRIGTLSTSASL